MGWSRRSSVIFVRIGLLDPEQRSNHGIVMSMYAIIDWMKLCVCPANAHESDRQHRQQVASCCLP